MILIVVWTEINYLTMLKEYRSILLAFAVSVAAALLLGALFLWVFRIEAVTAAAGRHHRRVRDYVYLVFCVDLSAFS